VSWHQRQQMLNSIHELKINITCVERRKRPVHA
jgi:hypothetical protein